MKTRICTVCFSALCLVMLALPSAGAEVTGPAAEGPAAAPTTKPAEGEKARPEEVALNLNNVDIDHVIAFLSQLTDKHVIKHKDAKAQISIVSPRKVKREEAIRLIGEALALEKVAIVERDQTMWLVPSSLLSEIDIGLLPPDTAKPPVGFVREFVEVRFADVGEIHKVIEPLLSKGATAVAHLPTRRILITDTAARIANIKAVIAQLDVLDIQDRQVKIFALKYADAEEIAPILSAVLGTGQKPAAAPSAPSPGKPPSPEPPKKTAGAPQVEVLAYKAANWLVVVAPKQELATATELVAQLDKQRPEELKLRIIKLKYAQAQDLARQLASVLQKRPEKRVRDTVEITANDRANALVVLSSDTNFQLIEEVVEKLDTEESVQMDTRTYELKHADADDVAEQMNELYSGMQEDYYDYYYFGWYSPRQRRERTYFVAERRTNSVIAIAPPNEFEKIEALIKKLDVPIDAEQITPRIYRIKYGDAKKLTDILNEIFGVEDLSQTGGYYYYRYLTSKTKPEVGRLYGKVRFVAETTTNTIIVTTNNKENFPIIKAFIEEIDRISPDMANTLVVELKNAKAMDVANQLNALFGTAGARPPEPKKPDEGEALREIFYPTFLYGQPERKAEERPISNLIGQVRVVPEPRINAVIVTTAVQNFETIKALIEELDVESPKVVITVRLIEVTRTRGSRLGARIGSSPAIFESEDFENGLAGALGYTWSQVYKFGTLTAEVNISALVQYLLRDYDARVLSDTTLSMNNNHESTVFVGSEIPFITKSTFSPEGTSKSDSFEYKQAGTELKITPNINRLNKVVMKVSLVSSQIRPGEVLLGGAVLDTRKFDTELAVEDGQTMALGGILREHEVESVKRVPILGYIPLLDLIFSKKDKEFQTTELVAFITPTVLRTPEDDQAATKRAARVLNAMDRARVPGLYRKPDASQKNEPE